MISYYLSDNRLTTKPGQQVAVVQNSGAIGEEELIDIITSDGSGVSRASVKAVMQRLAPAMLMMLKTGNTINLGVFNARVSIEGVFDDTLDGFDASRHRLKVNITPGVILESEIKKASVQKVESVKLYPSIEMFNDWVSKTTNDLITPNGHGKVVGKRLKFESDKADEGIYFVNSVSNEETKVLQVEQIKPQELLFLMPNLVAGSYRLEVRARISGGLELRTGVVGKLLTVV
jgi:hypothetical protein